MSRDGARSGVGERRAVASYQPSTGGGVQWSVATYRATLRNDCRQWLAGGARRARDEHTHRLGG